MRKGGRLSFFWALVRKELLVLFRLLPHTLLITLLLGAFAGLLTFAVMHTQAERAGQPVSIYLGIVMKDDVDASTSVLMRAAISAAKLPRVIHYEFSDEETALRRLKNNRYAAVAILDEGFVEAAMYGYETGITVILPETAGFESYLLSDLSQTAIAILTDIQGVSYAAHEVAQDAGFAYAMDDDGGEIADKFVRIMFQRTRWFEEESVRATGAMDHVQYYGRSLLLLLLLLVGIAYEPLFFYRSPAFLQKLRIRRIPAAAMPLVPVIAMAANGVLLTALIFGGASCVPALRPSLVIPPAAIPLLLAVILFCAVFTAAVHLLIRDRAGVIFALFAGTVLMLLFSGGLIPSFWLPDAFGVIAKFLPVTYLLDVLTSVFTGEPCTTSLLVLAGFAVLLWALASAAPLRAVSGGEGGAA